MNLARWDFTLDRQNHPPWAMDARHIDMIEAVVRLSGVKRAVEIGSYMGRSTTAFVEASEAGAALEWLGVCDLDPTASLGRVLRQANNLVIETRWGPSWSVNDWKAELWSIDGDHSPEGAIADVKLSIAGGAQIIVLHDTDHKAFTGPRLASEYLKSVFPYFFHDFEQRPDEETDRGLFIAFRHADWLAKVLFALEDISAR